MNFQLSIFFDKFALQQLGSDAHLVKKSDNDAEGRENEKNAGPVSAVQFALQDRRAGMERVLCNLGQTGKNENQEHHWDQRDDAVKCTRCCPPLLIREGRSQHHRGAQQQEHHQERSLARIPVPPLSPLDLAENDPRNHREGGKEHRELEECAVSDVVGFFVVLKVFEAKPPAHCEQDGRQNRRREVVEKDAG